MTYQIPPHVLAHLRKFHPRGVYLAPGRTPANDDGLWMKELWHQMKHAMTDEERQSIAAEIVALQTKMKRASKAPVMFAASAVRTRELTPVEKLRVKIHELSEELSEVLCANAAQTDSHVVGLKEKLKKLFMQLDELIPGVSKVSSVDGDAAGPSMLPGGIGLNASHATGTNSFVVSALRRSIASYKADLAQLDLSKVPANSPRRSKLKSQLAQAKSELKSQLGGRLDPGDVDADDEPSPADHAAVGIAASHDHGGNSFIASCERAAAELAAS